MSSRRFEDLLPTWIAWLEEVERHVTEIMGDRDIFQKVMKVVRANPKSHDPSDFLEWFSRHYSHSLVLSIRRQRDQNSQSVSLANLLRDMRNNAPLITRSWYLDQYPEDMRADGTAVKYFDKWSGPGKNHVNPAIMKKHLAELKRACSRVKQFVDKRIAHLKRVRYTEIPSSEDRSTRHSRSP